MLLAFVFVIAATEVRGITWSLPARHLCTLPHPAAAPTTVASTTAATPAAMALLLRPLPANVIHRVRKSSIVAAAVNDSVSAAIAAELVVLVLPLPGLDSTQRG